MATLGPIRNIYSDTIPRNLLGQNPLKIRFGQRKPSRESFSLSSTASGVPEVGCCSSCREHSIAAVAVEEIQAHGKIQPSDKFVEGTTDTSERREEKPCSDDYAQSSFQDPEKHRDSTTRAETKEHNTRNQKHQFKMPHANAKAANKIHHHVSAS